MNLRNASGIIFIPDEVSVEQALRRTTHMGIGAHPDDLEILAYDGILKSFHNDENWFFGVTVTDGRASPRDSLYAKYSDEEMRLVRREEQKKAAVVGQYSGLAMLDYTSAATKDPAHADVVEDLKNLVEAARPTTIYTHNPADKHDTHVAVVLRVIAALRQVREECKPKALYGCEVWRDLDWLVDEDKVAMDVSMHESLAASLVHLFDSQVCGGKRYDLATLGRRRANATYHATHGTDIATALIFGMDMTPLIHDPSLDIFEYVNRFIQRFAADVADRLGRLG
jgi:LmbE family N-acetylglucosaminyl deacetylase